MFVVTTLIAGIETQVSTLNAGISAFNTPTVVHFCAALLMAGILSAPWLAFSSVKLLLGLLALGMVFLGIHNAWDLVAYLAVERSHSENKSRE